MSGLLRSLIQDIDSFCVFSVFSEFSYEVAEIHDGITAFDLQFAMDQGSRYLRCAPHDYYCEALVVHPLQI